MLLLLKTTRFILLIIWIINSKNINAQQNFLGFSFGVNFNELQDHEVYNQTDVYGNSYSQYQIEDQWEHYGVYFQAGKNILAYKIGLYYLQAGPIGRDLPAISKVVGESSGNLSDFTISYISTQIDFQIRLINPNTKIVRYRDYYYTRTIKYLTPLLVPYFIISPEIHRRIKDSNIISQSASDIYESDLGKYFFAGSVGGGFQFNMLTNLERPIVISLEYRYGIGRTALTNDEFSIGGANSETIHSIRFGISYWLGY